MSAHFHEETRTARLPDTMRACVLRGPRDVLVEERPVPTPGPGEVLVEIASVGACGSDTHFYEHGRIGQVEVRYPRVLGHRRAVGSSPSVAESIPNGSESGSPWNRARPAGGASRARRVGTTCASM